MKFKVVFLGVVLLGSNSISCFASDGPSAHDYCESIQAQKVVLHRPSQWSLLKDVLRLVFTPGRLVHLQSTELSVPDSLRVQSDPQAEDSTDESSNIIFSISPPEDLLRSEPIDEMRQRYYEVNAEMAAMKVSLIYIVAATTIDDCVSRIGETSFDIKRLSSLTEERTSLQIIEQIDDARTVDKIIGKTLRHLKLAWKVVHSTDLTDVHEALQNPNIKNVVIFSHGLTEGKLVDSRISEYPLGFFSNISPSIQSLTIFACHGEEIAKNYRLSDFLSTGQSEYSKRKLMISIGTKIAGMDELVPVRAFQSFMKKVDRELAREELDVPLGPVLVKTTSCTMSIAPFKVARGTFGFILNGRFVGSVNAGTEASTVLLQFPCSDLDHRKNILTIHGLSLIQVPSTEPPHFTVSAHFPNGNPSHSELTHYFRADHSYQGSKFEFEI